MQIASTMGSAFPRILFALSASVLVVSGLMHAAAFGTTASAVAASDLAPFYANSLKALWLIDSATLISLALVFGLLVAQPAIARRAIVCLLAFIPAATALFLYMFIGNFLPAHMLIAAAAAATIGGLRLHA